MISLEEIVLKTGPMLSAKVAETLSKKTGIGVDAAKKRISRAKEPIKKLPIKFINNQSFVYHERHSNTPLFWERLEEALKSSAKAYYFVLKAFYFHSGYMKRDQLAAYSNSPIMLFTSRIQFDQIEAELLGVNIIESLDTETYKLNSSLFNSDNFNRFRAVEITKGKVIEDFSLWASKINIVSFSTAETLSSKAQVGGFQWAYSSPSYIQGLNPIPDKTKPGFVVADILIGRKVKKEDVEFFTNKIEILRSRPKLRRFIPILLCDFVEPEGLKLLREKGVIVGLIHELFGESYSQALRLLLETLTDATKTIEKDPNKFFELVKSLSKLKGKFGNIKGDLFELAIGYYYSLKNYPIKIGKVITDRETGKSKEIDVFVNDNTEMIFAECKAYDKPMEKHEVSEWLTKIPVVRKWVSFQEELASKKQTFVLWSASGFQAEAIELLESRSQSVSADKYTLDFLGRDEINQKIKEAKNTKLQEIMNSYFSSILEKQL